MPLTTSIPVVDHIVHLLLGQVPCLPTLGRLVVRHLNAAHLDTLARVRPTPPGECKAGEDGGARVVCLDEASAIEAAVAAEAMLAPQGEGAGASAMWNDPMHPSQRGHEAIAEEMICRFTRALEGPSPSTPRTRRCWERVADPQAPMMRALTADHSEQHS